MWWMEVLPPAILIGACIGAVGVINTGFQMLANGGKTRRVVETHFDWLLLNRDRRIAGREWETKGLEALADNQTDQ